MAAEGHGTEAAGWSDGSQRAGSVILAVEDDLAVVDLLRAYLEREGFIFLHAGSVAQMQDIFLRQAVHTILLDVGLPDADGWSALRWLRARSMVPIIMLTGRSDSVDRIVGLEMGADDYLGKPFVLRELLARIRTVQRRSTMAAPFPEQPRNTAATTEQMLFGGWVLDLAQQQLRTRGGEIVHLTNVEYRLLLELARHPNEPRGRDHLAEALMGRPLGPLDRSIDVHVSNLRRKLARGENSLDHIRTVRGYGYMFVPGT